MRLAITAAGLAAALAAGCTRVEIEQADGDVRIDDRFGFVTVEMAPAGQPQLVSVKGLGVSTVGDHTVFGYYHSEFAALPRDDCRIVFWVKQAGEVGRVRALLADRPDICVIGAKASETEGTEQ